MSTISLAQNVERRLENLSRRATRWAGSSWAFAFALVVIGAWLVTGPVFHFSDTWQIVINTGTTIVTFLMIFLIQRSQNKDSLAIHIKLNEIIAALEGASNRLIVVEDLSEREVETLHRHFQKLAKLAQQAGSIAASHSVEEAVSRHALKHEHGRAALRLVENQPRSKKTRQERTS